MLRFEISDKFVAYHKTPAARAEKAIGPTIRGVGVSTSDAPGLLKRAAIVAIAPVLGYVLVPTTVALAPAPTLLADARQNVLRVTGAWSSSFQERIRRAGVDYTSTGSTCAKDAPAGCPKPAFVDHPTPAGAPTKKRPI